MAILGGISMVLFAFLPDRRVSTRIESSDSLTFPLSLAFVTGKRRLELVCRVRNCRPCTESSIVQKRNVNENAYLKVEGCIAETTERTATLKEQISKHKSYVVPDIRTGHSITTLICICLFRSRYQKKKNATSIHRFPVHIVQARWCECSSIVVSSSSHPSTSTSDCSSRSGSPSCRRHYSLPR